MKTQHDRELFEKSLLEIEQHAVFQSQWLVTQSYNVATDSYYWCFGSMHFLQTDEFCEAFGIPKKNNEYLPETPHTNRIEWFKFKDWLRTRFNAEIVK